MLLVHGFRLNDDQGSPRWRNIGTRAIQRPLQMSDQTASGTFNCNHRFNENAPWEQNQKRHEDKVQITDDRTQAGIVQ